MSRKDGREIGPAANNFMLLEDIRQMIEATRSAVASTINAGLTTLYWNIGKRMREEILKGERVEYGQEIIASLGQELAKDFGREAVCQFFCKITNFKKFLGGKFQIGRSIFSRVHQKLDFKFTANSRHCRGASRCSKLNL